MSINLCNALKLPKKLVKAIKNMGKSKIWDGMWEKPTTKHASIYLLDADNDITTVFYCDESKTPWVNYRIYFCGIVAWAYAADIVNL